MYYSGYIGIIGYIKVILGYIRVIRYIGLYWDYRSYYGDLDSLNDKAVQVPDFFRILLVAFRGSWLPHHLQMA